MRAREKIRADFEANRQRLISTEFNENKNLIQRKVTALLKDNEEIKQEERIARQKSQQIDLSTEGSLDE